MIDDASRTSRRPTTTDVFARRFSDSYFSPGASRPNASTSGRPSPPCSATSLAIASNPTLLCGVNAAAPAPASPISDDTDPRRVSGMSTSMDDRREIPAPFWPCPPVVAPAPDAAPISTSPASASVSECSSSNRNGRACSSSLSSSSLDAICRSKRSTPTRPFSASAARRRDSSDVASDAEPNDDDRVRHPRKIPRTTLCGRTNLRGTRRFCSRRFRRDRRLARRRFRLRRRP